MDIKNAITPINVPTLNKKLYNKDEETRLDALAGVAGGFDLITPMWQYHKDGATKGAYQSSLESDFLITGSIKTTIHGFKIYANFDAKINWKNTANKALMDFNLALGEDFKKSNFSKNELEKAGLDLKNMTNLKQNIDKSTAFNIFLYQNIDKYLDVDYAIQKILGSGIYEKGNEEQDKQIKEFVKYQLMAHWEQSPASMEFIKNLTKDMDLNNAKIEKSKDDNQVIEPQNEPKSDEKSTRKAIKGKSQDKSTYSQNSQIYSEAFIKFINSQKLDFTDTENLLNALSKANIRA
ncbi:hypothetical protein HHI31_09005 [Campylobacter fetus subsp. venerealis]|uniref:hypothetical protein n=1 Tax=Campylobacter fetus TaxID=196 RepID=UPI0018E822F5|nr:hypothetical protein [Campylobacter fetus]QQF52955.1 hypothetical protein HHI31_09005 [Campylobacter fetus subsp. venerealis]